MSSLLNRLSEYILGVANPRYSPSQLIERESKLGNTIFGALPAGVTNRHFFYDKDGHWYFSQEFTIGQPRTETIHYHVSTRGIQKTTSVHFPNDPRQQVPLQHEWIAGEEVKNLLTAAGMYKQRIGEFYSKSPTKRAV